VVMRNIPMDCHAVMLLKMLLIFPTTNACDRVPNSQPHGCIHVSSPVLKISTYIVNPPECHFSPDSVFDLARFTHYRSLALMGDGYNNPKRRGRALEVYTSTFGSEKVQFRCDKRIEPVQTLTFEHLIRVGVARRHLNLINMIPYPLFTDCMSY
jgi:hypothetical protein